MGLLARLSTVAAPARWSAQGDPFAQRHMYGTYLPSTWVSSLSSAGVHVTPDLALTLSAFYAGTKIIAYDLATLPLQLYRRRDDGGKDKVTGGVSSQAGIGALAYRLRWAPNDYQTASEFLIGQFASLILREVCYAEIVKGPTGFMDQLLPRHPDRVQPERLPSGRIRYRLTELDGRVRPLTQDDMFVVRGLSFDGGVSVASAVQYGTESIGAAVATQRTAGRFFRSGMTASAVATYKGEKDEEDEKALHASITRYAAGVENAFGLLVIPDDVTIENLSIEPEKAQMMLAQEWGVREAARFLRLPGYKLGIKDAVAYGSQVQAALDYVIGTLRPPAVMYEQAVQRDLILAKDQYFSEFLLEALLRGDPDAQSAFLEKMIRMRVMRPSEARVILNMNPDPELDRLSAMDFRPGESSRTAGEDERRDVDRREGRRRGGDRALLRGMLAIHDQAVRCVRRERVAVEKLARKHADNPEAWQASLREFYADHAQFIAETMRLPIETARAYAAQHGTVFVAQGVVPIDGEAGQAWEQFEAGELAALVVEGDRVAA